MAERELDAYQLVERFNLSFTPPILDSRGLKDPEHVRRLYEHHAVRDLILIYSQQAYLGAMVYLLNIPLSSALAHISRPTTRREVEQFIDTTRQVHAAAANSGIRKPATIILPKRRGIVALGVLRSSLDGELRDTALNILKQDPIAETLHNQHPELYTGLKPADELPEILEYLADPSKSEQLADIDSHLETWLQWRPTQ